MPVPGPTVVRRQLGRRLRRLRAGAGVSVEHVVANAHLGISRAKLYKLEAGKHPVKPQDVAALCRHYGAGAEEADSLTELALATQGESWWHTYGDDTVPAWLGLYVDLEPAAAAIRTYQAELVPDLLQTPEYATAVHRASSFESFESFEVPAGEVERRVELQLARQAILERPRPPHLHVILNEAALLRLVGGPDVMAGQVARLRAAASTPGVDIDVLPLSAGAHPAMRAAFAILDFPEPDDDPALVYLDAPSSATYLQKPTDVARYTDIFAHLCEQTVPVLGFTG